jgi:hypothetical protein
MPTFRFNIIGPRPFADDGVDYPSAEAAWMEALRLVRDIEGCLQPGEIWTLEVLEEEAPTFRIEVITEDLRQKVKA